MATKFIEAFTTLFGKDKFYRRRSSVIDSAETIFVGSTLLKVPIEEDGTVLMSSVQMYFPASHGLWYIHDDKIRKSKLKLNPTTNKIIPPVDGWGERIYHAVFDASEVCSSFEKELAQEHFEIAIKFFHKSVKHLQSILEPTQPALLVEDSDINIKLFKDCSQYGYLTEPEVAIKETCLNGGSDQNHNNKLPSHV